MCSQHSKDGMKFVISVSKSYSHRGNHRHRTGTKKHWYVYYFEDGKFSTKRISALEVPYYKAQKRHRYRYICMDCGSLLVGLVTSRNKDVICPYCSE